MDVPKHIDNARVVLYVILDSSVKPTGTCRHIVGGVTQNNFKKLAICRYENDESCYLFYCNEDWQPITDTWHRTVEDAKNQAEGEYRGVEKLWQSP